MKTVKEITSKDLTALEAVDKMLCMLDDMRCMLGNDPDSAQRIDFAEEWCRKKGLKMKGDCFLCAYSDSRGRGYPEMCGRCPVRWPDGDCVKKDYYLSTPLDEYYAFLEAEYERLSEEEEYGREVNCEQK